MCFVEGEKVTRKERRGESEVAPGVDTGLRIFGGPMYPYKMKEAFEKGFRNVRRFRGSAKHGFLLNLTSQYPNAAFCVRVFPFGKATVLTSRKLVDEMNRAPPDVLSFDEVSQMVSRCLRAVSLLIQYITS